MLRRDEKGVVYQDGIVISKSCKDWEVRYLTSEYIKYNPESNIPSLWYTGLVTSTDVSTDTDTNTSKDTDTDKNTDKSNTESPVTSVSTNPSQPQSLKDQLNQDKEKEKTRKQNCNRIQEYGQYQTKKPDYEWDKSGVYIGGPGMKKILYDYISRYYIDPQDNVHYVSFRSYETTGDKKYPNINCEPFIGKIGKQNIKYEGSCEFSSFGGTFFIKDVEEYLVEGNQLTKYTQKLVVNSCHTSNPKTTDVSGINTQVFKKFR